MRLTVWVQFCIFLATSASQSIQPNESVSQSFSIENANLFTQENENLTIRIFKLCSNGYDCVHPIQCPMHVQQREDDEQLLKCTLSDEKQGYCCPFPSMLGERKNLIKRSPQQLSQAITEAREQLKINLISIENDSIANEISDDDHDDALQDVLTIQNLAKLENITFGDQFESISLSKRCSQYPCKNQNCRYRTYSGRCNNVDPYRSSWGSANYPMKKLLAPAYEDGIWAPRVRSKTGNFLKSPRLISSTLFPDINHQDQCLNVIMMQFGQFIVHDIAETATIKTKGGKKIDCCGKGAYCGGQKNIACMPIDVCDNDPFYSKYKVRCLNFVRSKLASPQQCKLSYGRQVNAVSHFIDASHIYGTSKNQSTGLRQQKYGKLRIFEMEGRNLLPIVSNKEGACSDKARACFLTGDERSNSIISLTTFHTLFLREHNRVATILSSINPHWTEEVIFQETRRIVIAEFQHIIYNEYLPLLVGPKHMANFKLYVDKTYTCYNPNVDPSIASEFAAAAMRVGHSMVPGQFQMKYQNVPIPSVMDNPSRLLDPMFFDTMIKGMTSQRMQAVDNSFTHGLTHFLFPGNKSHGSDLTAINIQRGRDHGIRPYNDYLILSGYPPVRNFQDFRYSKSCNLLAKVYDCPDDIDLYVGGILETHVAGGIVGPTFADIISDQFHRLKYGDRYFYTHGPKSNPGAFATCQLAEIQKITLSHIICANADGSYLSSYPKSAFRIPCKDNPIISCKDLPKINYNFWKDCKGNSCY